MRWRDRVRKDLKKFNIDGEEVVSVGTGQEWLEEKLQDRTRGCG